MFRIVGGHAIQLTRSGQDRRPVFSDDGEKIVFYRGSTSEKNQVYVIDADGLGERELVTSNLLAALRLGYDEFTELHSLAFVPGTHQLLFNTHQLSTVNSKSAGWYYPPSNDLLLVDTDTGEIRRLITIGRGGSFLVSPDGKQVAVQTSDHIDLIDLYGQIVHRNLATYSADDAHTLIPMFWTQDSNELIILPSDIHPLAGGVPIVRSVWRYSLDGNPGKEIPLYPPPLYDEYAVSPDGNWIAYSFNPHSLTVDLGDASFGVYLGNLRDGTSQLLYIPQPDKDNEYRDVPNYYYGWSPDSVHFIVHDLRDRLFMGNTHGEIVPIGGGLLLGWIDTEHYLFYDGSVVGEVGRQERVRTVEILPGVNYLELVAFVFLEH